MLLHKACVPPLWLVVVVQVMMVTTLVSSLRVPMAPSAAGAFWKFRQDHNNLLLGGESLLSSFNSTSSGDGLFLSSLTTTGDGLFSSSSSSSSSTRNLNELRCEDGDTDDGQPFLWKIKKEEDDQVVGYGIGTIHLPYELVTTTESWNSLENVLNDVCGIYGELDPTDHDMSLSNQRCVNELLPNAATVQDIPDETLRDLYLNEIQVMVNDVGLPTQFESAFQETFPIQLVQQAISAYHTPGYKDHWFTALVQQREPPSLDHTLLAYGRPSGSLETTETQCQILRTFYPTVTELQTNFDTYWKSSLEETLSTLSLDTVIHPYQCGNLQTTLSQLDIANLPQDMANFVFDERNMLMEQEMVRIMETQSSSSSSSSTNGEEDGGGGGGGGPPLFVIGLAHWTVGNHSLEVLLQQDGYSMERVEGSYTAEEVPDITDAMCAAKQPQKFHFDESTTTTTTTTDNGSSTTTKEELGMIVRVAWLRDWTTDGFERCDHCERQGCIPAYSAYIESACWGGLRINVRGGSSQHVKMNDTHICRRDYLNSDSCHYYFDDEVDDCLVTDGSGDHLRPLGNCVTGDPHDLNYHYFPNSCIESPVPVGPFVTPFVPRTIYQTPDFCNYQLDKNTPRLTGWVPSGPNGCMQGTVLVRNEDENDDDDAPAELILGSFRRYCDDSGRQITEFYTDTKCSQQTNPVPYSIQHETTAHCGIDLLPPDPTERQQLQRIETDCDQPKYHCKDLSYLDFTKGVPTYDVPNTTTTTSGSGRSNGSSSGPATLSTSVILVMTFVGWFVALTVGWV